MTRLDSHGILQVVKVPGTCILLISIDRNTTGMLATSDSRMSFDKSWLCNWMAIPATWKLPGRVWWSPWSPSLSPRHLGLWQEIDLDCHEVPGGFFFDGLEWVFLPFKMDCSKSCVVKSPFKKKRCRTGTLKVGAETIKQPDRAIKVAPLPREKKKPSPPVSVDLCGGFNYFIFSPVFGEDSHFH